MVAGHYPVRHAVFFAHIEKARLLPDGRGARWRWRGKLGGRGGYPCGTALAFRAVEAVISRDEAAVLARAGNGRLVLRGGRRGVLSFRGGCSPGAGRVRLPGLFALRRSHAAAWHPQDQVLCGHQGRHHPRPPTAHQSQRLLAGVRHRRAGGRHQAGPACALSRSR